MIFEAFIYLIATLGAVFIAGFSVHMLVGGLIAADTEERLIVGACIVVVCVAAYMAWDVIQRRTGRK